VRAHHVEQVGRATDRDTDLSCHSAPTVGTDQVLRAHGAGTTVLVGNLDGDAFTMGLHGRHGGAEADVCKRKSLGVAPQDRFQPNLRQHRVIRRAGLRVLLGIRAAAPRVADGDLPAMQRRRPTERRVPGSTAYGMPRGGCRLDVVGQAYGAQNLDRTLIEADRLRVDRRPRMPFEQRMSHPQSTQEDRRGQAHGAGTDDDDGVLISRGHWRPPLAGEAAVVGRLRRPDARAHIPLQASREAHVQAVLRNRRS
jgi:hypothetical protein